MLLPYLWEYKWRVLIAMVFLASAKLANVGVPLLLKSVVDALSPAQQVLALPLALLVAYGVLRLSTVLFAELRDVVFVRVTQRAIRRVALTVFRHLHSLSLRFHLDRQTGGVTRDIERGTRGISTLLSYMLFSIIPVILEFSLVAVVLLTKFDWRFAAVTFAAVAIYLFFTVSVTEWRMDIRRQANELDSKANTRAIDSLLNYETVKYFNNEEYEARRYDENLQKYESAAVRNEVSLGLLNVGQSCVIAVAVTRRSVHSFAILLDPAVYSAQFSRRGLPRNQTGADRHRPHVSAAGTESRNSGQSRRDRARCGERFHSFRARGFFLRPQAANPVRCVLRRSRRHQGRGSGAFRRRQVHAGAAAVSFL